MSAEEANRIARTAERLRRGTRLPLKVLLPTVAAIGAGGAWAAAAIPGSGGVITACYSTETGMADVYTTGSADGSNNDLLQPQYGSLRVIDPNASPVTDTVLFDDSTTTANAYVNACAPNEQTITWNQQGVPGLNGTNGTNGANGSNGADGKAGQDGSIDGAATFEIDAGRGTELYAKLSDISGSSKLAGQGGLIPLQTFAFGAVSPVLSTSKGSEISRQAVQTFEFTKKNDKTNAELFQDWQQGKTIARMDVQADHATKGQLSKGQVTQDANFSLTNVRIKSIKQAGGQETVIGTFTKVQSSFGTGTSKVEGSLNPGASTSWDLTTQKTS